MFDLKLGIAVGASLILTSFILDWVKGRKGRAVKRLAYDVIFFLGFLSLYITFLPYLNQVSFELFESFSMTLERIAGKARRYLDMITQTSLSLAIFDIILGIVFAGTRSVETLLSSYQTPMHIILGFLETIAYYMGTLMLLAQILFKLSSFLPNLFTLLLFMTPLLFIPRVWRIILPIWLTLFAIAVYTPLAVESLPDVSFLEFQGIGATSGLGFVHLHVKELSGSPIYRPVVSLAIRDSHGNLFVARVRENSILILPMGNYTVLWVLDYWINFTLRACCYADEKQRAWSYCNCYVWPANFTVLNGSTVTIQVNLPVDVIEDHYGHTGHVIGFIGDNVIHPEKGEGFVWYSFDLSDLERGATITVRGGSFKLERILGDQKECPLNVTIGSEKPPGILMDLSWYRDAVEEGRNWLDRIKYGLSKESLKDINITSGEVPNYQEYSIHLQASHCNFSQASIPLVKIIIHGKGVWNETKTPIYIQYWHIIREYSRLLLEKESKYLETILTFYNALVSLLFTDVAIIALGGVVDASLSAFLRDIIRQERGKNLSLSRMLSIFRAKQVELGKVYVELYTPQGATRLEIPSRRRSNNLSSLFKEYPIPLFFRSLQYSSLKRSSRILYKVSKYGPKLFEKKISANLYEYLELGSKFVRKKVAFLRGYTTYTAKQLDFRAKDAVLRASHAGFYYNLLLGRYKEVVLEDLESYSGLLPASLLEELRGSKDVNQIDSLLFNVFLRNPSIIKELLVKHKIYADEGEELFSLQLHYRLTAIDRAKQEDRAEAKTARALYLEGGRALRKIFEENTRWKSLWRRVKVYKQ